MVITTSLARTAASSSFFGWAPLARRSMPISAMASTTVGLSSSAGADPAERTTTRSPPWWASSAAAIWERPALWMQTNRTSGRVSRSGIGGLAAGVGIEEADEPVRDGEPDELGGDEHRHRRRRDPGERVG